MLYKKTLAPASYTKSRAAQKRTVVVIDKWFGENCKSGLVATSGYFARLFRDAIRQFSDKYLKINYHTEVFL